MEIREVDKHECLEEFDLLMSAVKRTQDWRERVLLSHGLMPPTSYYRILLFMLVYEYSNDEPIALSLLAKRTAITTSSMANIVRRMAYDGLMTVTNQRGAKSTKQVALTSEGRLMAVA